MHQIPQIKTYNIKENTVAGLEPADYDKAILQRNNNSNRYYKGQEVPLLAQLPHFKMYGVGIYLFFSFLKHVAILFAILTIISIVPIIFNATKGNTLRNSPKALNIYLTRTSLGSYKYSVMTASNAYDLSISYKDLNVAFDILSCVIYLIFCLYWEKKSRKISQHISKQIKLQSNFTVQAIQFPEDSKQTYVEAYMNRFGHVTEVVAARDYTKEIQISKQIYELQLQKRQFEFQDKDSHQIQINQIDQKLRNLHLDLDLVSTRSHEITKFYIQFSTPEQRNKVLSIFYPYQRLCNCCKQIPQQMLFQNSMVKVAPCNTQPTGILWQNAHFTWRMRIPRILLQLFIVLGFIIGGFIFISFLNILIPPIQTDIDTTNIDYNRILVLQNQTITEAWCVQNYAIQGSSSPYFSTCSSYWKLYLNATIISISISVIIMILCEVIKKIVYALASFQRYSTKAQQSVTIMTNLFIMDFLTTTLITFLMQANIFSLSILGFLRTLTSSPDLHNNINSITEYKDLIPGWYKDIGYQIWFNIFIQIFLPQIFQPFVSYLQECLAQRKAKKEKIHQNMLKVLEYADFQIEDLYSNFLVIIATGVIFGGGIPLMMVIVFLCMFVRYFYLRFMFTRFYKVPLNYNQILNERVISILKIILLIRCLISIYMYGAEDVFAMEKSTFMKWASSLSLPVFSSIFIVFSRILLTWYYSIFVIFFILVLIFKQLIFKAIRNLKKCRKQKQQLQTKQNITQTQIIEQPNNNQNITASQIQQSIQSWASNQNQSVKSQRMNIKSYRLQCNPLYSQVLAIMKLKVKNQSSIIQQHNTNPFDNSKMNQSRKRQINPI